VFRKAFANDTKCTLSFQYTSCHVLLYYYSRVKKELKLRELFPAVTYSHSRNSIVALYFIKTKFVLFFIEMRD
jgi:hypothetical protein